MEEHSTNQVAASTSVQHTVSPLMIVFYLFSLYLPPVLHFLLWPLSLAAPTSLNLAACSQAEATEVTRTNRLSIVCFFFFFFV